MPITIVTTAGDPTANSFASEADFIDYLSKRLNVPAGSTTSGPTCTEAEKAALIEATRDLNEVSYVGSRATVTQALAWPRLYAINPDAQSIQALGNIALLYFASDEIPKRVKTATCELALQYRKAGGTDLASLDQSLNVIEKTVDVLTTKYAEPYQRPQGLARFPRVIGELRPLFDPAALGTSIVRT